MKLSPNLPPMPSVSAKGTVTQDLRQGAGLPATFDTDMKGADLDALMRFNDMLPQPAKVKGQQPKKPGEDKALGETSEVVSDSPEWLASDEQVWQVAQAEIGGAAAASGATAGAAGSGAGAAGAAGAAAGAGSAVAIVSPLAFTPSLLLVGGGGGNAAPVIDENTSKLQGSVTENLDTDVLLNAVQIVTTGQVKFRDPDAGDTPVASVVSANAVLAYVADGDVSASPLPANLDADALKGAFSITEAGVWTFDASTLNLEELGEGDKITLTYTVTVTDDLGATDTTPVVITIHGANDAPVLNAGLKGDGITKVYLEVNAESGQETTCAKLSAEDIDVGETETLKYYFLVGGERKSTDGFFSIDADSGHISLTETGALEAGVQKYDLACASYTVQVVAFDGIVNSNVEEIRIERTLPDLNSPATPDTWYDFFSMTQEPVNGDEPMYGEDQVLRQDHGHKTCLTIDDTLFVHENSKISFDILDMGRSVDGAEKLSVRRNDSSLSLEFENVDGHEYTLTVSNHYAPNSDGKSGSVEYIHFDHTTAYAGYQLSSDADEILNACDVSFFPENGSYRISAQSATADGNTLEGTFCNDLIAGSSEFKEHLSGGAGSDLLFASGGCDTLEGGSGNDLLVLDGEHAQVVFSDAIENGSDTVVNFDEAHDMYLSIHGLSTAAFIQEDDQLCTNLAEGVVLQESGEDSSVLVFSEDAASAAVIAMDTESSFNLHTWITTLEEESSIQGIEVESGASQYYLVEDADGNTQLYFGSDKGGDGLLTADEFIHTAQFTGTGIGEFSLDNVLFAAAPVL